MTQPLSAEDLSEKIKKLEKEITEHHLHRLVGIEKVVKEFFGLHLPQASEILDLETGSGILSAKLQARGYSNVDALDEDKNVIDKLRALRLYRNYINKPIHGINSTGLHEESYDCIISAGGIAPDAISPLEINEILRILKEDGVLLFAERADYHSTEFGLFEGNLRMMEKDGKLQILKVENFQDKWMDTEGVFYAIKRCPTQLPEYAKKKLPTAFYAEVDRIIRDESSSDTRGQFYDQWSDNYDTSLVVVGHYTGHIKCVEAFLKLGLDRKVNILDLACGTGLLGLELNKKGYDMVDGLDHSIGMLDKSKERDIYKNYILCDVGDIGSIPVNNESYDVVLSSNGFAPGQILPTAFPEIFRVLRPGGYMIFTMRDGYQHTSQQFSMLELDINDLVNSGEAELIVGPVIFPHFLLQHSGRFYMMRKPAVHHYALHSPHHSPAHSPKMARKQMDHEMGHKSFAY